MIIIGEKINATRSEVREALENKNRSLIENLACSQVDAGANYLDINGGDPNKEVEYVNWLIDVVQNAVDVPLCIDSTNTEAIKSALTKVKHTPIINSISLEKSRLDALLPVVKDNDCSVIALLMSDDGLPSTADDRLKRAEELIGILKDAGRSEDKIFVDPCFLTIYTEQNAGIELLEGIRLIREKFPNIHISGGISNSSFGLPKRKWINLAYLVLAMGAGLDTCIIDPTVPGTMELVLASEVILGKDQMGMNYITKMRD